MLSKRILAAFFTVILSTTSMSAVFAQEHYSNTAVVIQSGKTTQYHSDSTNPSLIAQAKINEIKKKIMDKIERQFGTSCITLPKEHKEPTEEWMTEIESKIQSLQQLINQLYAKFQRITLPAPENLDEANKPQETPSVNEYAYSDHELKVLELTNELRTQNNLPALALDDQLSNAAKTHSEDMAANQTLNHDSSDGTSFGDRLQSLVTYHYSTSGENIACGYDTAEAVVEGWANSPGHRENMLNPSFHKMGIARITSTDTTAYWTQDFTD